MTVKDAIAAYFARLPADHPLFRTAIVEDIDPLLFTHPPDADGSARWAPRAKSVALNFSDLEERAGTLLHPSVKAYYSAFWFMAMGGRFGSHRITLDPMVPGDDLAGLERKLFGATFGSFRTTGYIAAHGGTLRHVPVGLCHPSDRLLVVDNSSGEVMAEDHERGTFEVTAPGLVELIDGLRV